MTKNETAKLLAVLEAYYMSADMDPEIMVNAWHMAFARDDYRMLEQAAISFAANDNRDYPKFPVPGQIKARADLLFKSGDSPEELWNLVYKAICNSGYNSKEEFEKLPNCCQKWVGNPRNLKDYGTMDIVAVNSVLRGQFLKTIKIIKEREEAQERLPNEVKQLAQAFF